MGKVLSDMHLADAIANQNFPSKGGNDTIAWKTKSFSTLIFKKYGIDSSSFRKSFRYYVQRPELMDSIYSKMITDLTRMQSKMQHEGSKSTPAVNMPAPAPQKKGAVVPSPAHEGLPEAPANRRAPVFNQVPVNPAR